MGALMLVVLVWGATPEAALLEKLGARAQALEQFSAHAQLKVEVVADELDGEGKVTKHTRTSLEVKRDGEAVTRKLLTYLEDGKDLTEDKRAELEKPPRKSDAVRSPFHPSLQGKYRFALLEPRPGATGLTRIAFEPAGEKSETLTQGEATVDPQTGDLVTLAMRPSKYPAFVEALSIEASLDAVTAGGRAMSRLTIKGTAGALFFKKRFRVVTTFSDYQAR